MSASHQGRAAKVKISTAKISLRFEPGHSYSTGRHSPSASHEIDGAFLPLPSNSGMSAENLNVGGDTVEVKYGSPNAVNSDTVLNSIIDV